MVEKIKKTLLNILKEILCGLMQVLFSRVNFFSIISPVGLPFALARLFYGGNIFSVTFFYLVSNIYLFFIGINNLIIVGYEIIFLALYFFTKEFVKSKNSNVTLLYVFIVLSNALKLYYYVNEINLLSLFLANIFLQCFIQLFFYILFDHYQKKFIFCKFSKIDYILISIAILFLSIGLFSYNFVYLFLCQLILNLAMIISCKAVKTEKFFVFSIIISLGIFISTGDINFILYSSLCSIGFIAIKYSGKFLFSIYSIIIFLVSSYVFKLPLIPCLYSTFGSVFIFILVQTKWLISLSTFFSQSETNYIYKISNENKIKYVQSKLILMSNALKNMNNNLKYLIVGKIDRNKACSQLSIDVIKNCCANCEYYKSCFMGTIDKKNMIEEIIKRTIEYGNISSVDLSNGLQSYCNKSMILISEINKISKMYLSYESSIKSEDESKLIISNELQNFSDIFQKFSGIIDNFSILNEKLSMVLKDSLIGNMIDVKEVAIFENKNGIKYINVISNNEQILKKEMKDTIQRVIKNNVKLKETKHIEYSGLSLATFLPISKIKISFAVSTKSKEQKNGDNVIIERIDENKYFVALADGMGHGEKANKISTMVLSLIKSLFEVGFDEELVIQSVNKLLIPAGLDNFTTLDSCIIDLENEIATFVKLGSSVSVIKHKSTSEIIKCDSLPIGMIQNISPTIIKKTIIADDTIFLASDGIVDSFNSVDNYKNYINDSQIFDLKKFLDEVIFDADFNNFKHKDDMTIIGINLLKNFKK